MEQPFQRRSVHDPDALVRRAGARALARAPFAVLELSTVRHMPLCRAFSMQPSVLEPLIRRAAHGNYTSTAPLAVELLITSRHWPLWSPATIVPPRRP